MSQGQPNTGRDFESRVAQLYRAFGYSVEHDVLLDGQQVDLKVDRNMDGVGRISAIVECKDWDKRVGNQAAQEFVNTVSALRARNAVNAGVMVSSKGFTAQAKSIGDSV